MSFLTGYGTLWSVIPQTTGRVFWVSPGATYTVGGETYSASNDNDGLSPERALRTIARAITLATADADDVIALLPGAHTVSTASLALTKARLTITGLPGGKGNRLRPRTSITTDITGDQIANITAANIEIAHLRFIPITAAAALDFSAAADNLYVHDCSFDMATPAASTSTLGLDATGGASNVLIEDCYFEVDAAQGACIDMTGTLDSVVNRCWFQNSAGTHAASITAGAATDRLLIADCAWQITNAAAVTACIDGTGATIASGVLVKGCYFGDRNTVPVDNFDAGECELAENYEAGLGATDGGVLITAIT